MKYSVGSAQPYFGRFYSFDTEKEALAAAAKRSLRKQYGGITHDQFVTYDGKVIARYSSGEEVS